MEHTCKKVTGGFTALTLYREATSGVHKKPDYMSELEWVRAKVQAQLRLEKLVEGCSACKKQAFDEFEALKASEVLRTSSKPKSNIKPMQKGSDKFNRSNSPSKPTGNITIISDDHLDSGNWVD